MLSLAISLSTLLAIELLNSLCQAYDLHNAEMMARSLSASSSSRTVTGGDSQAHDVQTGLLPSLTAAEISQAKHAVLQRWIDVINDAAMKEEVAKCALSGKRPRKMKAIPRTGKVDVLKNRLASYLHIDLSAGPSKQDAAGSAIESPRRPSTYQIDMKIRIGQWAYLRDLCSEWRETLQSGKEFLLLRRPLPGMSSWIEPRSFFDSIVV